MSVDMDNMAENVDVRRAVLRDRTCVGGHDKVYSSVVLTAYPAILTWICRRCLAEGAEREGVPPSDEYERLKRRKESAP